jgi:hypothetical protein
MSLTGRVTLVTFIAISLWQAVRIDALQKTCSRLQREKVEFYAGYNRRMDAVCTNVFLDKDGFSSQNATRLDPWPADVECVNGKCKSMEAK